MVGSTSPTSTPRAGEKTRDGIVVRTVEGGNATEAKGIIGRGLGSNGPLHTPGLHCARPVADADGTVALGTRLARVLERLRVRAPEFDGPRPVSWALGALR